MLNSCCEEAIERDIGQNLDSPCGLFLVHSQIIIKLTFILHYYFQSQAIKGMEFSIGLRVKKHDFVSEE